MKSNKNSRDILLINIIKPYQVSEMEQVAIQPGF